MTQQDRRAALLLREPSGPRFLFVALLIPILIGTIMLWFITEYQRSEDVRAQLVRSYNQRFEQLALLSELKDAERSQRGYLLTGQDIFLARYEPIRMSIRHRIAAAAAAAAPDVAPDYYARIGALVGAKFAELDRTIALARGGEMARARGVVAAGSGRAIMDRLEAMIGAQVRREEWRTADRRAAFVVRRQTLQSTMLTLIGIVSILLGIILFGIWRLRRERYALLVETFDAAERNATILDSTIDAIVILNPSGTIESMNAAASRMTGYRADDLVRRDIATILDIAPGDDSFHKRVGLVDGHLRRSLLADQAIRHRDGRQIAVDVAMGVMNLPGGDHLVVSLRDISERKRIERIKDDLVSTVSHELRTPLASIVGALALLRAGGVGARAIGDAGRLIEIAENNSRRLIRLINDMLDIDRIESGRLALVLEPIDLRTVVDDACVGSRGLAEDAGVEIVCAVPDDQVMVMGDADRLLQVITNLVSNAVRVSPPRAAVAVTLRVEERAILAVEDCGPGIPLHFRDRIFGRFERADPSDHSVGTGLGLAISREIVRGHDGAIWFKDRAGGGTSFFVSLALLAPGGTGEASDPAGHDRSEPVGWIETPEPPQPVATAIRTALAHGAPRRPVILYLDDDRDLLDVVAAALATDARIVPATTIAEARAILRHTIPDAAILDVRLAEGTGLDLLPFLVDGDGRAIPRILYSAQDVAIDIAVQADAVLVKARGSLPDLKAAIRRILDARADREAKR